MKKGTGFFHRSISLIVLFGVLICLPASALSFIPKFETESINFDGTQSSWAESELKEAYENGLTYGQIENNYQKPITREEFCVIVVKLYEKLGGKAPVLGTNPFTDTDNAEILKAYALGIVKGTSDTTFAPANNITRQEICVMILRALKAAKPGIDTSLGSDFPFQDSSSIASWALDAMKFAYKNDIMKGTSTTTISPLNNTNREQAIILLKRTFTKYSEAPEAQGQADPDEYYSSLLNGRAPSLNKNVFKPFVPANDSGSSSYSQFTAGTALSSGIVISPTGPGLDITDSLKEKPGSDLRLLTPEEIEKYWDEYYDFPDESDYEPSVDWVKASDNVLGVDCLGKGYDVIKGKFADPYSLKDSVLSTNKLLEAKRVFKTDGRQSVSRFTEGKSLYSYSKEMARKIGVSGGYLYFSGSINASFGSQTYTETNSRYATLVSDLSQYLIEFDDNYLDYSKYYDSSFKKDIEDDSVTPEEIFNRYGTHVIRAVKMGGRLDYNVQANSSYHSGSHTFESEVKASFNMAFASAGASHSTSQKETTTSFNENCEINIKAYPDYLGSNTITPSQYTAWGEYVRKYPAMCDFGEDTPLIPIYNLARNPFRRYELKKAYEKYAEENQYIPTAAITCINGIRLNPQPVGRTLDGLDEQVIIDPITNDKWYLVANITAHDFYRDEIQQQIYIRTGFSDLASRPPVVAVFLVNESQGENAKEIFKKYWGNDPTAKLWGDGGEAKSDPSLKNEISSYADRLKLYYVTSTKGRPITALRVKHLGYDNLIRYYPPKDINSPHDDYGKFFSVIDYGTHMKQGINENQNCAEGAVPLPFGPAHQNIYLQYSHDYSISY
jgi:hypothetical protein